MNWLRLPKAWPPRIWETYSSIQRAAPSRFPAWGFFLRATWSILGPDGTVMCSSNPGSVSRSVNYGSESWFKDTDRTDVLVGPVIDAHPPAPPRIIKAFPSESGVVVAGLLDLQGHGQRFVGSVRRSTPIRVCGG